MFGIHNTAFRHQPAATITTITSREVDVIITAGTSIENQTNEETDTKLWGQEYIKNKYGADVELLDVAVGGSRIQELVATLATHLVDYADRKNVTLMLNHGFNDTNNGTFLSITQAEQDKKNDDLRYVYDFATSVGWHVVQGSITHSSYTNATYPEGIFVADPTQPVTDYGPFDYIRDWIVPIMKEYIPAYVRNDSDLSIEWPMVDSYNATRNIKDVWRDINDLADYVHPSSFGRIIHLTTQLDGVMDIAQGRTPKEVIKRDYNANYGLASGTDIVFSFGQNETSSANINFINKAQGTEGGIFIQNAVDTNGAPTSVNLYSYYDRSVNNGLGNAGDDSATLSNNALLSGALAKDDNLQAGSTVQPAMHVMVEGLEPMKRYNMEYVVSSATTSSQFVFLHDGIASDEQVAFSTDTVNPETQIKSAEVLSDYKGRLFVAVEPENSSAFISGLRVYSDGSTANQPPTANAGAEQTNITAGATVTLDGSGSSDPDGDPLTYLWTQTAGAPVTLSSNTAQSPTFTAPDTTSAQTLSFSLVVNDGTEDSAPDTVDIGVLSNGEIVGYDVILLIGQSNMVGRNGPIDPVLDAIDSRIKQYGSTRKVLEIAQDPLDHLDETANTVGPGLSLAKHYADNYLQSGREVLLVPAADGGTAFGTGFWRQGGTGYNNAIARANEAISLGVGTRIVMMAWHQGESDRTMTETEYAADLDALISGFRSEIVGASNTPFIVGEINPNSTQYGAGVAAALLDTPNRVSAAGYVPTSDIPLGGDNLHFSASSSRILGIRYSEVYGTVGVSDLNISISGIPDGTYYAGVYDPLDLSTAVFDGNLIASSGVLTAPNLPVAVGTNLVVLAPDNRPTAGGAFFGVTE